jgi:subtilisin family serine protease
MIDSGIEESHPELIGRVKTIDIGLGTKDKEGHGTHVAGTIVGKNTGIAPDAQLTSIRIFDDQGISTTEYLLQGLQAVSKAFKESKKTNAVLNLSIGSEKQESSAVNAAIEELHRMGLVVVSAAGNDSADACQFEPSDSPSVITVGSIDQRDRMSPFSNFGKCVDVFAPGAQIRSSIPGGKYGVMDGTSMSAPHVSAVAAVYLSSGLTAEQTVKAILDGSTQNAIKGLPKDTQNRIAYLSASGQMPPKVLK